VGAIAEPTPTRTNPAPSEDWERRFASKLATPEEAVRAIAPGRSILIGSGAAEPSRLVEAMVTHSEKLADNEVVHLLTLGPAPYVQPGMEHRFRHMAFFIGPNVRAAVQEGRADFMPVFLSEIPDLIRSRRVKIDVALIQVSPPDRHGYVSLGVSVDIVRAAVNTAELILAEVNPNMPRTHGDSFLHSSRITRLLPVDYALPELEVREPDEVSREIGRHVARLIPDGATVQAGIGKIPNAVMTALADHADLGIHTEMFSDGVMQLVEAGVINGRKKTLLPGKLVASFIMGSRRLYDWVDDHPAVEMRPSQFTNDPATIARNDQMVAINSALALDLTGQVAADTLMGRFFSGIGGQVDFIRGAAGSRGGKAIIAMPSTAKGGTLSRIRATLEEGAGIVTSRGDVHYVVTEYGVADLWGKNIRQRAMRLIEIAHPDFRAELLSAAKRRRYVFPDQVAPRAAYPWAEAQSHVLPGGRTVTVRPVRLTDEEDVQDLFYRLSDESTYRRFLGLKRRHPHQEMQRLVDLDYEQSMALLVCVTEGGHEELIGMSRYDVNPANRLADIAFVVRDEWQGRGVGTLLMKRMGEIARSRGLAGFTADVLASNRPMISVFQKSGLKIELELRSGTYHLQARFDKNGMGKRGTAHPGKRRG
jgi:acyl-CoA hydrolase/GNAT superfamily N-acetyltransferase